MLFKLFSKVCGCIGHILDFVKIMRECEFMCIYFSEGKFAIIWCRNLTWKYLFFKSIICIICSLHSNT